MVEKKKEEVESQAVKAEKTLISSWYILEPTGKLHELSVKDGKVSGFTFGKYDNLRKFTSYEMAKSREVKEEPAHVRFMKRLEIADYEPGSDSGNMRFYPKGRLIKSLLETYVNQRLNDYGAMEVETPLMYDTTHTALKKYLDRFPARRYVIETPNKTVFLRFSADFGQFLMAHDMTMSYKDLPAKLYELTRYSFRLEQHGELTGLRRLRAFTMPDCHAFVHDIEHAKEEMIKRFGLAWDIQANIGFELPNDLEFAIRVTKDFYDNNREFVLELVKRWNKPALIEMWSQQFFYFVMKYEWNFVDSTDKAAALTTDQMDVESSETFDINFTDRDGKKKKPIILHLSPTGALERTIYAMLERAHFHHKAGLPPSIPLWLSPTQARIIPVSQEQIEHCERLSTQLHNIRVDVDDTTDTLGKKIKKAEEEWIPYILVIGQKETAAGMISVRNRVTGKQTSMTAEQFIIEVTTQTKHMPFKPLPLPKLLSKRPIFVG